MIKKLLERVILWVAHHFGAERQIIPSLHTTPYDKIKEGVMYEWYGRIVKAVRNPMEVKITYLIWPNKGMSQQAIDLICKNTDKMQLFDTMYRTTDTGLGKALKADGSVEISEDIKGTPCHMCCMDNNMPCPICDFRHYWIKVAEYKQYATDQKAYMRMMKKKINKR